MSEHRVIVLDLDGVVNWRVPAQKAGIPLLGNAPDPERYLNPITILPVQRENLDPTSLKSIYDGVRHSFSPVFPDVTRVIRSLNEASIYGSTGRHQNEPMLAATIFSYVWAGIYNKFDDIYFRSAGYTTTEAKVSALADIRKQWDDDQIEVVDDNPGDLLPMSRTFPKVRFHLIRDWTTKGLLRGVNMDNFPNVNQSSTLRKALLS